MAAAAAASVSASASASLSLSQHRSVVPKHHGVSLNSRIRVPARFSSNGFTSRIRATSAVAAEPELRSPAEDDTEAEFFACPICYEPLIRKGPSGFNVPAIYRSGFKCRKCNKSYSSKDIYLDLTVTSGTKQYNEVKPARSELFRSPIVSFLYERGWRQNFNRSGFPGPDEEFKMAQEYFKVVEGGVLVDISCGSGLFSRKFAKSGAYSKVVALDFSENMLRQCYDFIKNDESIISSNLALVRADVSRLPFSSGSIDAVHAGAALHCWPSPSNAIAEINRILRSGGVFVGTTFLRVNPSAPTIFRALEQELKSPAQDATEAELFACPICFEPLIRKGPSGFNVPAIYRSGFKCRKCSKSYSSKNIYLDLTVTSGTKEYSESKPTGTELFRSPVVSFLYERGWRQSFIQGGFPGPDEEFNMAQEYFKGAEGGVLVDVSCGSGLFSRKFAKSEVYSKVIALDFSENMLRQCYDFIKMDESICNSNLALVRADVSRLPFFSGSVDAVHAGAALHCWPSPSNAIAEINRILCSGGVFVGTTFLRVNPSAPPILRALQQSSTQMYSFFTQEEIEDLVTTCGLINYTSKVQGGFIIFSAQKR